MQVFSNLISPMLFQPMPFVSVTKANGWAAMANQTFYCNAIAKAPDNTQNFFGRGNETEFNKTGDYKKFYRTRFTIYQVDPAFRWRGDNGSSFSMGPSFQFYHYDSG